MSDVDQLAQDIQDMEEALDEARVLDAREDFISFCEYVMVDDQGKSWKASEHHRAWAARFEGEDLLNLLIASRGSGKTTWVQAYVLFVLGVNPNTCIKYVCGSDDLAKDRLQFLSTNIKSNESYHRVFPHVAPSSVVDEWTKHKIFIERPAAAGLQDASVEASSVTAAGTGGRAHLIIFDDIIDATVALVRPGALATVKAMVESDWMNCLYPGGRAIMIGTFWSFDPQDIYVEYSERPEWNPWIGPACHMDDHGQLTGPYLWPGRWGKEALDERRKAIGEGPFQQQYLLKGTVSRSQYFSPEHIAGCVTTSAELGDTPFEIIKIGMGVDVATSLKKKTGSYSCIYVTGLGRDGRKIPLAIVRVQAKPEIIAEAVIELYLRWLPQTILVENNATQETLISLINVIGENYGIRNLPVKGRFTGERKWHPDAGLPGMNAELAQSKWLIPMGGNHREPNHECTVCIWIEEMTYWGKNRTPKGRKPTTDIIMAWWLSNGAIDGGGSFGVVPIVGMAERKEVSLSGV